MSKLLTEVLDELMVYDSEGDEWKLNDLNADASFWIRDAIVEHLKTLIKPVPKPVFGSHEAPDIADYNKAVEDLIIDIEEGNL